MKLKRMSVELSPGHEALATRFALRTSVYNELFEMLKSIQCIVFLFLLAGCDQNKDASPSCHGGTILGKIRGAGGGVAISVDDSSFGTYSWHNASNVVEALNVPDSLWVEGMRLYFMARPATETEKSFPISADGDESDKPLIFVTKFSLNDCAGSQ